MWLGKSNLVGTSCRGSPLLISVTGEAQIEREDLIKCTFTLQFSQMMKLVWEEEKMEVKLI